MRRLLTLSALVCLCAGTAAAAWAQQSDGKAAAQWLAEFSKGWDESKWEKSFRTAPGGYMRPLDNTGWKVRMQALQGVVARGKDALPDLVEALSTCPKTIPCFPVGFAGEWCSSIGGRFHGG